MLQKSFYFTRTETLKACVDYCLLKSAQKTQNGYSKP